MENYGFVTIGLEEYRELLDTETRVNLVEEELNREIYTSPETIAKLLGLSNVLARQTKRREEYFANKCTEEELP